MEEDQLNKMNFRAQTQNSDLEQLKNDHITFKLALRKKKFNDILAKKRIIPQKPNSSSRPYEFFLSKLDLPDTFKLIFSKKDDLIKTALDCMKSNDITSVIYGVCQIKTYFTNFIEDENILDNFNLNFVSDILNLLEKYCEKKEKAIIYNLLHILTNYSYLNNNSLINKILLSSKGYKVWELCFDLQDYEIMSQMVWVLHNITYKENEGSCNLIKSNFFKNKIYPFYSSQAILQHMNEKNEENIFYLIIQRGIELFSNLISVKFPSSFDSGHKFELIIQLFDLLLQYSMSISEKIYNTCIYTLSLSIDAELNLLDRLDNPINNNINLLNDILNKKFFSNESLVLFANRIIGNYLSMKSGLSEEFYLKCIQYEFDIFFGIKLPKAVRETYWVLSNILSDYPNAGKIICANVIFINKTMDYYQNEVELNNIGDIAYFLNCLICKCGIENFIRLQEKGIIDITMKYAKMTFKQIKPLVYIFDLIESLLYIGNSVSGNFEGRNLIKEKCDTFGLKEILEKYENTKNDELLDAIEKINSNHYNEMLF